MMNNNGLQEREILDVIRILSSQGATGRLQISTGMTEGALFFARGQLVDARLGRLNGFQAINALVSVPDATYNFDPTIAPSAQSSIAPNERLLLKDFFGIEVGDYEQPQDDVAAGWIEDDTAPEQVVPLSEVSAEYADDHSLRANEDDEATLVRPRPDVADQRPEPVVVDPQPEPVFAEPRFEPPAVDPQPEPIFAEHRFEPAVAEPRPEPVGTYRQPPLTRERVTSSRLVPALLLILVTLLMAVAAVALLNRFRQPESTASVTPPLQTSPSAGVAQTQPETQTSRQPDMQPAQQPATQTPQQAETASAVPDLSGNWTVINTVEQTSYEPYRNMQIGFNVAINQAGRDFTGTGQKISENGRDLPAGGRTSILVKGTIEGDQVHATFSESGALRKTNGQFVWRIDRGSHGLTGTFISTAARTRGTSAAKKVL